MATKQEVQDSIKLISEYAIENYKNSKVLPSLVIAQMCLESGYLTSELAKNANNPFGIKFNKNITNTSYDYKGCKWCKFDSLKRAVQAQGEFYNRYDRYKGIVGETDIERVLSVLETSGYCEGNGYSLKIKDMIDRYNLLQYDSEVIVKKGVMDDDYYTALDKLKEKNIVSSALWKDVNSIKPQHIRSLIIKISKIL